MALDYHPKTGTIVICDFKGFIKPEMVKKRPAVIISPRFRRRNKLCTIVPLSTTPPNPVMKYHCKLEFDKPLPKPYNSPFHWVKGDMLATVSLNRLFLPYKGKNAQGKREYVIKIIEGDDFIKIQKCILYAVGLFRLTKNL
jgi:mRNA interferase MazF